jgi:hypothetical protein
VNGPYRSIEVEETRDYAVEVRDFAREIRAARRRAVARAVLTGLGWLFVTIAAVFGLDAIILFVFG